MRELEGDIWNFWREGNWIVIPTNGSVTKRGLCVMGRGLALQAKHKFPMLPNLLGTGIKSIGNVVIAFPKFRLFSFPVKRDWWEKARLTLVEKSAQSLGEINIKVPFPIYLPKVGCGNGGLQWCDVKPVLEKYLVETIFIVCDFV
jgi:hypothetical protein